MREVSKDQFYAKIGPLNVAGRITNNNWPYTMEFYNQSGYSREPLARMVGELDGVFERQRYFIA